MKLKIISDGTNLGTKVIDENGNWIEQVQSVNWTLDTGGIPIVSITLVQPECEINHKGIITS